jgi:hypothetical protein
MPNIDDVSYIVSQLSANPTSNCALHYVVRKLGGKIVIPLAEFEATVQKVRDAEHPLIAYFDDKEGIILQVVE